MRQILAKSVLFAFLIIAAFLIVLHHTHVRTDVYAVPSLKRNPWVPRYANLWIVTATFMAAYFVHMFLTNNQLSCPYVSLVIIAGFLWGMLAYHNRPLLVATQILRVGPSVLMLIYLPILMFNIAFSLDVPIFLKTLPQIMVIGIPVCLLTAISFGFMAKLIINPTWSTELGILFGLFASPIYPLFITSIYKQHSTRTRQISMLLEGEALLTILVTDVIQRIVLAHMGEIVLKWYQFVAIMIRFVVIGGLHGYLMGVLGRYLIKKMYANKLSVHMVCFLLPFCTHLLAQGYTSGCGSIPVVIMAAMLGMERRTVTKEIEKFLVNFWSVVGFVLEAIVCAKCAMVAGAFISPFLSHSDYVLMLGIYLLYFIVRFCCFLLFLPIIRRLGYGMDLKNLLVCVWSALKCPFSLEIVGVLEERNFPVDVVEKFYFHIMGLYLLSHLINGSFTYTILESLELTKISTARQMNMNNCMKHIFGKRDKTIAILKHDRILADTNWAIVMEFTNIRHPYQNVLETAEADSFFLGYRYTYCSDCLKDVPLEPTPKEMREMMKEAKKRILKAKKMSYSRQYENGMMSNEAIMVLTQAVELAMDSEEVEVKVEHLYAHFVAENWFQRLVRRRVEMLSKKKLISRPPRTYWRRICYHIVVTKPKLAKFMLAVVFLNLIIIAVDIYFHPSVIFLKIVTPHKNVVDYVFMVTKMPFMLLYLAEFIIKILAYSWIYVCSHGFRTYFKSYSNVTEFVILVACVLETIHDLFDSYHMWKIDYYRYRHVIDVIQLLRVLRFIGFFQIFYPDILVYLNRRTDKLMASTYELGKSYAIGEAEIVEMLPRMIDNKKIRHEIQTKMEKDRVVLTKMAGIVQKERPWVAITVKTRQAIRTILNGMSAGIERLKTTGWIDLYEHALLNASMDELLKKVNSIKKVEPSLPKVIFKEVAWMAEDETVIDFLFENVIMKTFEPGDVVFDENQVADGIYIVVTGLLMITYNPDQQVIRAMQEFGRLPIVDYLPGTKYEEPNVDYIVSGNCIGELSTLTGRPYNSVIVADVHCQVYVLNRGVINKAMELSPDPVAGLECRIWKEVSIRVAVSLLLAIPAHQDSQDQIKEALERAFVPNLSRYKIFTVTQIIEDVLLIEGVVADFNTRKVFTAPCYIPRTVQKLILPTSSLCKIPTNTQTKLLIVPVKDVDEFDVMARAEEDCELINTGSPVLCLQHTAQDRIRQRKKRRLRQRMSSSNSLLGRNNRVTSHTSTNDIGASKSSMFYKNDRSESTSGSISADVAESAVHPQKSKQNFFRT